MNASNEYSCPSPVELVLVRHGTTVDNLASRWSGWRDTPLSESGLIQARLVAEYLSEIEAVDALYASPLNRALVTARMVADCLGLEPLVHQGLKESYFGEIEGMEDAEVQRLYPAMYERAKDFTDLDFAWPGGESRRQFVERLRCTMRQIIASNCGKRVLVVGHGGMFSLFLADLMEHDPSRWPKYMMNNCSVSRVAIGPEGPNLHMLNYCAHLEAGPPGLADEAKAAPPLWKLPASR